MTFVGTGRRCAASRFPSDVSMVHVLNAPSVDVVCIQEVQVHRSVSLVCVWRHNEVATRLWKHLSVFLTCAPRFSVSSGTRQSLVSVCQISSRRASFVHSVAHDVSGTWASRCKFPWIRQRTRLELHGTRCLHLRFPRSTQWTPMWMCLTSAYS